MFLDDIVGDAECAEKLTAIHICGRFPPGLADNCYSGLKSLPHVRTISVEYTHGADAFLEDIQGMANVEELWFHHATFSKVGARRLISLPHLTQLDLDNATDALLEEIGRVTRLETLHLAYGSVSDTGLAHLKGLTKLKELHLWDTEVSDMGVKRLQQALPGCKIKRESPTKDERQGPAAPDQPGG